MELQVKAKPTLLYDIEMCGKLEQVRNGQGLKNTIGQG